jgi:hypothetical protein
MTMELQRAACRGALMAPTGEMKNVDEKEVRDSDWIAQRERFVDILSRDENFGSWPKAMSLLDESALSRKIGLSLATLRDWRPSGPPFFELPGHLIRYRPREVAHWLEERLGLKQHEKHAKRNRSEEDRFERISTCFHAAAREIKASAIGDGTKVAKFLAVTPAILEEWRERKIGPDFVALPGMPVAYSRLAVETWLDMRGKNNNQ